MQFPEQLSTETMGEYRARNNFPHIYTPFFPGTEQVEWQTELQQKFPVISFYPYDGLHVSKAAEMCVVVFEDESHINEMTRELIVRFCSGYGREHAEKNVPTVALLRDMYSMNRHYL